MTRRTDGPFPVWEIIPGQLYQRGKLHGLPVDAVESGLKHYGVTHAVALAPTKPDHRLPVYVDYAFDPMPDGLLRTEDHMLSLAGYYADLINEEGAVVLTMCNAGRNRSGLLSALIVRELSGLSGAAAMELVREHRPRALANPYFERFLEGLE